MAQIFDVRCEGLWPYVWKRRWRRNQVEGHIDAVDGAAPLDVLPSRERPVASTRWREPSSDLEGGSHPDGVASAEKLSPGAVIVDDTASCFGVPPRSRLVWWLAFLRLRPSQ